MLNSLCVLHRKNQKTPLLTDEGKASLTRTHLLVNTCLRQVLVLKADEIEKVNWATDDQIVFAQDAYRLLLELMCGLQSALIGETQVFGQFKEKIQNLSYQITPWDLQLKRIFQFLMEDSKKIRSTYLYNTGSQTYGSHTRKLIADLDEVHVVGSGSFALDILPYVTGQNKKTFVYARTVESAKERLKSIKHLEIKPLNQTIAKEAKGALLILAPLSQEALMEWADNSLNRFSYVVDFRADSANFVSHWPTGISHLQDFVKEFEEHSKKLENIKSNALSAVQEMVDKRTKFIEYRPFGWDDLCA